MLPTFRYRDFVTRLAKEYTPNEEFPLDNLVIHMCLSSLSAFRHPRTQSVHILKYQIVQSTAKPHHIRHHFLTSASRSQYQLAKTTTTTCIQEICTTESFKFLNYIVSNLLNNFTIIWFCFQFPNSVVFLKKNFVNIFQMCNKVNVCI